MEELEAENLFENQTRFEPECNVVYLAAAVEERQWYVSLAGCKPFHQRRVDEQAGHAVHAKDATAVVDQTHQNELHRATEKKKTAGSDELDMESQCP